MDLCARGLLVAAKMIEKDALGEHVAQRYALWNGKLGKSIMAGKQSLSDLAALVDRTGLEPQPRSGRQEQLEALVNTYL
jgi:xylose isomerase